MQTLQFIRPKLRVFEKPFGNLKFYCMVHNKENNNNTAGGLTGKPASSASSAASLIQNASEKPLSSDLNITGDAQNVSSLGHLLDRNKAWANKLTEWNPSFFRDLSHQQSPELLWLGCSDSRVPANQIIDLLPGQVFVHRNIANIIHPTDMNCLAVLQFAIKVLKVKHIIVCGHYGCGGILAAMEKGKSHGVILDQWLGQVKEMIAVYKDQLVSLP